MPDLFDDRSSGLESPGSSADDVVPNDVTDLAVFSRALYIGTGGDIQGEAVPAGGFNFPDGPNIPSSSNLSGKKNRSALAPAGSARRARDNRR